ncbi:hypothetical protein [Helicobacter bilis]|nr:hypothetical protein [Helicobacter bilis]
MQRVRKISLLNMTTIRFKTTQQNLALFIVKSTKDLNKSLQ